MKAKIAWASLAIIVIVAILAAVVWFVPIFKPRNIEVQGLYNLTEQAVVEAADVDSEDNLLRLDEAAIGHRVSDLEWVDSVNVRKQLPNTVVITVTEHEAVAHTALDDQFAIFDADGRIFMYSEQPYGIAVVDTPEDEDAATAARKAAATVLAELPEQYLADIVEVSAPSDEEISLITVDGRRIFWGTPENNEAKVVAMQYAITRAENNIDISGAPIIAVN